MNNKSEKSGNINLLGYKYNSRVVVRENDANTAKAIRQAATMEGKQISLQGREFFLLKDKINGTNGKVIPFPGLIEEPKLPSKKSDLPVKKINFLYGKHHSHGVYDVYEKRLPAQYSSHQLIGFQVNDPRTGNGYVLLEVDPGPGTGLEEMKAA